MENPNLNEHVASIVASYVSRNPMAITDLPLVINTVYGAISAMSTEGGGVPVITEPLRPAVSIKKSVTPEYLICLEDGKKLKMLKRHLRTSYDLTPDEYRAKWGLSGDYPMVAPNYAARRSEFAKAIGLGHSRRIAAPVPAPVRRVRKGKAAAAA